MAQVLRRAWHALWSGTVSPTPLSLFRIGIAILVLARTTDYLRPYLDLDHHLWTVGVEFSPEAERVQQPALHSPLVRFIPPLSDSAMALLTNVRTLLAVMLLLGIATRPTALVLFMVGYGLMAADRYRYLHHMHLLWMSVGWLALIPAPDTLSVARLYSWSAQRAAEPAVQAPRWGIQLLRWQALVVYGATGLSKLDASWLAGRELGLMAEAHLVGGALFYRAEAAFGASGIALGVCAVELALLPLLVVRRTRWLGVMAGLALHLALSTAMVVSVFGALMGLYLGLFLPWRESADERSGETAATTEADYRVDPAVR